jgi:hypothetical protein
MMCGPLPREVHPSQPPTSPLLGPTLHLTHPSQNPKVVRPPPWDSLPYLCLDTCLSSKRLHFASWAIKETSPHSLIHHFFELKLCYRNLAPSFLALAIIHSTHFSLESIGAICCCKALSFRFNKKLWRIWSNQEYFDFLFSYEVTLFSYALCLVWTSFLSKVVCLSRSINNIMADLYM